MKNIFNKVAEVLEESAFMDDEIDEIVTIEDCCIYFVSKKEYGIDTEEMEDYLYEKLNLGFCIEETGCIESLGIREYSITN